MTTAYFISEVYELDNSQDVVIIEELTSEQVHIKEELYGRIQEEKSHYPTGTRKHELNKLYCQYYSITGANYHIIASQGEYKEGKTVKEKEIARYLR